jgi:sec-independent protein translocase protein TatA
MELVIIAIICLLIFGPKALPSLGKSIGSGIRNLKAGIAAKDDEVDAEEDAEARRVRDLEKRVAEYEKKPKD